MHVLASELAALLAEIEPTPPAPDSEEQGMPAFAN